jgi:hypothetical protein
MDNLEVLLSREYWLTKHGQKKFPHEFDDEHLANTIRFLHRSARKFRLEQARTMCNMIHKTGNLGADIDQYYRVYQKQMDDCLGELDDKQWLRNNSKIYNMLIEEAKHRNVDYSDVPTKTTYKGKVEGKYNFAKKFSYIFNA